jgi:hypothetical protein
VARTPGVAADAGKPSYVQVAFSQPFTARSATIVSGPRRGGFRGALPSSRDGREFALPN